MIIPPSFVAAAQAAQARWKFWASVSLAQCYIESAGGRFTPPGSNNLFGIQQLTGLPYVESPSHEWRGGQLVPVVERFAKFATVAEAFDWHARLIATNRAYVRAMAAPDAEGAALALTGVYATAPGYGQILVNLMRADALEQYDLPTLAAPVPTPEPPIAPRKTISAGVVGLQRALNAAGFPVVVDGAFGPLTRLAVRAFQGKAGLAVDGDPGPLTLAALADAQP